MAVLTFKNLLALAEEHARPALKSIFFSHADPKLEFHGEVGDAILSDAAGASLSFSLSLSLSLPKICPLPFPSHTSDPTAQVF